MSTEEKEVRRGVYRKSMGPEGVKSDKGVYPDLLSYMWQDLYRIRAPREKSNRMSNNVLMSF